MTDTIYIYRGPPSGVTLRGEHGRQREVLLHPGEQVQLPADNAYVRRLVSRGLLSVVTEAPKHRPVAPKKATPRARQPTQDKETR